MAPFIFDPDKAVPPPSAHTFIDELSLETFLERYKRDDETPPGGKRAKIPHFPAVLASDDGWRALLRRTPDLRSLADVQRLVVRHGLTILYSCNEFRTLEKNRKHAAEELVLEERIVMWASPQLYNIRDTTLILRDRLEKPANTSVDSGSSDLLEELAGLTCLPESMLLTQAVIASFATSESWIPDPRLREVCRDETGRFREYLGGLW